MSNQEFIRSAQELIDRVASAATDNFVELIKTAELNLKEDFAGAELIGIDLRNIDLKNADLSGANLSNSNLSGTNLDRANLKEANLSRANLSGATFRQADLTNANLTEVQARNTDLSGATLTGACLESWRTDNTTQLDGVLCDYVYLLNDQRERRPSIGKFVPGEFSKLFQEILHTVDIIFRNGVDWQAFVAAFNRVRVENENIELTIQSIESKGNGVVVVKFIIPLDANKAKFHYEFTQQYELASEEFKARYKTELKVEESEITTYREQSANMWTVINSLAARPIQVHAKAIAKVTNDSIISELSGLVSGVVNLGDISGQVTNTINQLTVSSQPDEPSIKELLEQLHWAIVSSEELMLGDKAEALEQVKALAEAAKDPAEAAKKNVAKSAIRWFKGMLTELAEPSAIVQISEHVLPQIARVFGL
uniref:pentapeptide repeat-containing protein n=1 Tax=Trichocoleus desertorum TaxID=1481672 RepID=UPI0025B5B8ED|nr:pentapeptide repeat-containing protein [Trichocoleus desertorum]